MLRGGLRRVVVDRWDGQAYECYACVGVAVWHGVLRYERPPTVGLYDEEGREVEPGRVAVRFQETPVRLPHELWVRFRTPRPPSDQEWSARVAASTDLTGLLAGAAR